jgi:4-amino-4-deoxy-L-arabinose transferase-like glycosyltransferase
MPSLRRWYQIALVVYFARTLAVAVVAPFPIPFDEHAHLSYVLYLAAGSPLLPDLDAMRLVDLADFGRWLEQRNHLNHPPGYYWLMALLAQALPSEAVVLGLRLANVALSTAAVAVTFWIARRAGWSPAAQLSFLALVVFVPTLPVLGGIISNDNLALLGGVLGCAGAFVLLQGERGWRPWCLMALGLFLAALAKLTAGLLCGLLLTIVLAMAARRRGLGLLWWPGLCALALAGAVASWPYLMFCLSHGSPAPTTDGLQALLDARLAEAAPWQDQRLLPGAYLVHFLASLLVYWPPNTPSSRLELGLLAAPLLTFALCLAGVALAFRQPRTWSVDPTRALVACGALALAGLMLVHFAFAYALHLETGWYRAVHPRYYLPALPILPAAFALLVMHMRSSGAMWLAATGIASTVGYGMLAGIASKVAAAG